MRLTSIKLSGFKSFAESTQFQLPGQLVGVVGPNGCGKSNIIDAVRWVLGESKASELRGESMQDVIFNGSGQRKPAGRASVELVFDNTAARAGGQWNQYAEIAVRRVLTRDGTSSYFINNQAVRRRDVHDVFLGTGLGPRAYAIIGQGTISRIIESRPEELRLFLEEAAGVSKYKERRRETELRLRDARENLTRVEDILRELDGQLERLERQAEVAQRYRSLQELGLERLHMLWQLKLRDAAGEEARVRSALAEAAAALEAETARLREVELGLDQARQSHWGAADELMRAQRELAEATMLVHRLEERIRHHHDSRQRIERRLAELQALDAQWQERSEAARVEIEALQTRAVEAEETTIEAAARVETCQTALLADEEQQVSRRQRSDRCRAEVAEVRQRLMQWDSERRNLEERERDLVRRVERARDDLGRQAAEMSGADLDAMQQQLAEAEGLELEATVRLEDQQAAMDGLEGARQQQQSALLHERSRLAELQARLQALTVMQERQRAQDRLQPWLQRQGLEDRPGLWQRLRVEAGWEPAFEAVLGPRLQALEVGSLDRLGGFEADAPPAKLVFHPDPCTLPIGAVMSPSSAQGAVHLSPLIDRVVQADPALRDLLQQWLSGWRTAPTLAVALAGRSALAADQAIVTPAGHAVTPTTVAFHAVSGTGGDAGGQLQRAAEIAELEREQQAQVLLSESTQTELVRTEAALAQSRQQLQSLRQELERATARRHGLQIDVTRLGQQQAQARLRRDQIEQDLREWEALIEQLGERREIGEARFEELDQQLALAQEAEMTADDALTELQRQLGDSRTRLMAAERAAQEAQYQLRALGDRVREHQRTVESAATQLRQHAEMQAAQRAELEQFDSDADGEREALEDAIEARLQAEARHRTVQQRHDELSQLLREGEQQRQTLERSLVPWRERIHALELEAQAAQLGCSQYAEQLDAAGVDRQQLESRITEQGVRLYGLQSEIDRIQRDVAALGAVNLAALDELGSARERKTFLDHQQADLLEAAQTLEDAIRAIDQETRELLRSTFDAVNEQFGRMFPSLFGGGQARLMMTGEEMLDAGVQVMAQPPGKKNSTIHLLSGGEKALTAIALVFAIFQLNPAPFCLLDEVDAPLDDANTTRYARLVKSMSSSTQFLFISHNKIAMEMAEQLIGVTMQEQGVSRIVAVDMERAVAWSEAS
jgi:chromosome segregation protein